MSRAAKITFGSITYLDDSWHIACEPHVRTKLKRVFPQVNQRAGDVVVISDSDENCRDLLWFIDRYPMTVDPLKRMRQRAAGHVEAETLVHELLSKLRPPEDFELALPPRTYQSAAVTLAMIKSGLLVADVPGLGKTVTGICAMARKCNLPVLVVTLTHLTTQWRDEINKFAPDLKVHILKSGKQYDLVEKPNKRRASGQAGLFDEASEQGRAPDVIVTNYHKLHGWADTLAGSIKLLVLDEAQEIRHRDSNKYAAVKHIARKATLRLGLTATPIFNLGNEFWNVIDVLQPGVLGTYDEFLREWCEDGERIRDPRAFGAYLRREGIMIRRTRKDVGRELPPCQPVPHTISSDQSVLERIKGTATELARVILANQQAYRGQKFRASEEFNVLMRQATGIAKAPHVAEFVRMLMASEEKVIVYAWHREVYAILMEQLAEFKPRMFTGSESAKQKEDAKQAFIHGDCRVILMSLRAGAGTDGMQAVCKVGVFAELDWSPGCHEQCIGRFFRDGQDETSMAYFLLAEDGSDPVIADVLGIKKGQIDGVRDPDAELIEELEVDPGNMKKLAQAYLNRIGAAADAAVVASQPTADEEEMSLA